MRGRKPVFWSLAAAGLLMGWAAALWGAPPAAGEYEVLNESGRVVGRAVVQATSDATLSLVTVTDDQGNRLYSGTISERIRGVVMWEAVSGRTQERHQGRFVFDEVRRMWRADQTSPRAVVRWLRPAPVE